MSKFWSGLEAALIFVAGMLIHGIWLAGKATFGAGEKSHQFQVFGERLKSIEDKVSSIPKLEADMRVMKQALADNGIKILNGGH